MVVISRYYEYNENQIRIFEGNIKNRMIKEIEDIPIIKSHGNMYRLLNVGGKFIITGKENCKEVICLDIK